MRTTVATASHRHQNFPLPVTCVVRSGQLCEHVLEGLDWLVEEAGRRGLRLVAAHCICNRCSPARSPVPQSRSMPRVP